LAKFIDITNRRFGRLVALKVQKQDQHGFRLWKCRCDCRAITIVRQSHLHSGAIRSCGCLNSELSAKRKLTHGGTYLPEYAVWSTMHARCRNPNNKRWEHYGGRGIKVCKRWSKFENFIADMGQRPNAAYSLERINNNRGYSPKNCEWATAEKQSRNRRKRRWFRKP
jgi:hypothetical protein